MSFIAPEPPPNQTPPTKVSNDGFFPDIDLSHARLTLRLDGTVTESRLAHAITAAVLEVGNTLRFWKSSLFQSRNDPERGARMRGVQVDQVE